MAVLPKLLQQRRPGGGRPESVGVLLLTASMRPRESRIGRSPTPPEHRARRAARPVQRLDGRRIWRGRHPLDARRRRRRRELHRRWGRCRGRCRCRPACPCTYGRAASRPQRRRAIVGRQAGRHDEAHSSARGARAPARVPGMADTDSHARDRRPGTARFRDDQQRPLSHLGRRRIGGARAGAVAFPRRLPMTASNPADAAGPSHRRRHPRTNARNRARPKRRTRHPASEPDPPAAMSGHGARARQSRRCSWTSDEPRRRPARGARTTGRTHPPSSRHWPAIAARSSGPTLLRRTLDRVVWSQAQREQRHGHLAQRLLDFEAGKQRWSRQGAPALRHGNARRVSRRRANETVAGAQAMVEKPERLAEGERERKRQPRQLHREQDRHRRRPGSAPRSACGSSPARRRRCRICRCPLLTWLAWVRTGQVPACCHEKRAAAHRRIHHA